jgi:hypothetical protein
MNLNNIPDLKFLPLCKILVHEEHDIQRIRPLVLRLQANGVLRNPPIVSPLKDRTDRFLVLDGANRTTAFKEMEYAHALVQIIQPDDPGLKLSQWNHILWEIEPNRLINGFEKIEGIELSFITKQSPELSTGGQCSLVKVVMNDGKSINLSGNVTSINECVHFLHQIVNSYKFSARLDRTSSEDPSMFSNIYPQLGGIVVFPNFQLADVMNLAGNGVLLPAGITRFSISPRVLHINYPLEELAASKTIEEKNTTLHKWIQERIAGKSVRFYSEPTILFDE